MKTVCEKYNLEKHIWKKLPPMTSNTAYWHSCTTFTNKILYSGNDIDMYLYDPNINSHVPVLGF